MNIVLSKGGQSGDQPKGKEEEEEKREEEENEKFEKEQIWRICTT